MSERGPSDKWLAIVGPCVFELFGCGPSKNSKTKTPSRLEKRLRTTKKCPPKNCHKNTTFAKGLAVNSSCQIFKSSKSGKSKKKSPQKKCWKSNHISDLQRSARISHPWGYKIPSMINVCRNFHRLLSFQKPPIVPDLNGILLTIQGDRVQTRDLRCVCHFLREMDRWRVGLMGKQKTTRKTTQISHKNLTLSKSHSVS